MVVHLLLWSMRTFPGTGGAAEDQSSEVMTFYHTSGSLCTKSEARFWWRVSVGNVSIPRELSPVSHGLLLESRPDGNGRLDDFLKCSRCRSDAPRRIVQRTSTSLERGLSGWPRPR